MTNNVERISKEITPVTEFPPPEDQKPKQKSPPPQITIPPPSQFTSPNAERLTVQFEQLAIKNAKEQSPSKKGPFSPRPKSKLVRSNTENEQALEKSYQLSRSGSLRKCMSSGKLTVISKPLVQDMLPKDRIKLKEDLEKLTQLETPIPEGVEPPAEYTRAVRGLKIIHEFEKEIQNKRNEQIIQLIISNQDNFLKKFFIAGESIISFKDIFSAILPYVELPEKKGSPRTTILFFLLFCSNWLHVNRGTIAVKNVQDQINQIIEATSTHPERSTKNQSKKLKENLELALKDQPSYYKEIHFDPLKSQDFYAFLNDGINNPNTYQNMVITIAKDLFCRQVQLYTHITEKDFFKKQGTAEPTSIELTINHANRLSDYIIDTILSTGNFEKRVLLIKFFIDIGKQCLSMKDFASASAIGASFFMGAFSRIPNTWAAVKSSTIHETMLERFKELFSGIRNFKELREYANAYKDDIHIPYIGIYQKDLTMLSECSSFLDDVDSLYNIDKMSSIALIIENCLAIKDKFKHPEYMHLSYSTNFVTKVIACHTAIDENVRYSLTDLLSDSAK